MSGISLLSAQCRKSCHSQSIVVANDIWGRVKARYVRWAPSRVFLSPSSVNYLVKRGNISYTVVLGPRGYVV